MTSLDDGRHTAAALAWAAETIGGQIVRQERQKRWRPTFYLEIEKPDGSVKHVILRGFRAKKDDLGVRVEAHLNEE